MLLSILGRDFILHAYGADCLETHSKLLILGKSIDNPPTPAPHTTEYQTPSAHTPSHTKSETKCVGVGMDTKYAHIYKHPSLFHNKMYVKEFRTMTHILSPTRARTTIIADINPNTILPQYLLNMVIKNLAGRK
ncbi:hypothetical protein EON63_12075 [archaeon]|nr:MAG: hypothetical protein EON63_12075 [archaeon]